MQTEGGFMYALLQNPDEIVDGNLSAASAIVALYTTMANGGRTLLDDVFISGYLVPSLLVAV
jgi:hypothetical protein